MDKQNKIIYDWLSFTTKIHSLDSIIGFLGLVNVPFEECRGRYCYNDRLSYDGINIMYNGRDDMGICVEFSGQGCRNFETFGTGDYQSIFDLIIENWSPDKEKRQMNITRLDVAYDDLIGVLDLNYLMTAAQKGEYVSRCEDIEVIYSNKGCSVCHGSRTSSNVYIRIYDKKMERNRSDLDHWIRCEIKLKDECARGFINIDGDLRKNYFDVLNNYLRYVIPTDDSNKRRAASSPQWLSFIESWDSVSVFDKPGTSYNLSHLDGYITSQLSGAISTYINILGLEAFCKNIKEAQEEKHKLNPKYKHLLQTNSTSNDSILAFLEERGAL